MGENKEIQALIQLLDDPDPMVFGHVEEKLKSFGECNVVNVQSFKDKVRYLV